MSVRRADQPNTMHTGEGVGEKARRKFKENPFVPIGALATTAALLVAMVKMRRGESKQFNVWLRVRVVAQGLTVAALVIGTYTFRPQNVGSNAEEVALRREEKQGRERNAFEERLRLAEENHRIEMGGKPVPVQTAAEREISSTEGWWTRMGWSRSGNVGGESENRWSPTETPSVPPSVSAPIPKTSGWWGKLGRDNSSSSEGGRKS